MDVLVLQDYKLRARVFYERLVENSQAKTDGCAHLPVGKR